MAHQGGDGSSGRKRPNALTPQNKATASLWFLQQAQFGLRFGLRLGPLQVPPPYTRVSYTSLTCDWGLVIVNWVYLP